MRAAVGTTLRIADMGMPQILEYREALESHGGDSWFGVAVGFRMLQAAGLALSQPRLWDRRDLLVTSCHPGDGVRDAVEYVTRCVSRNRYVLDCTGSGCSRAMQFSWRVRHAGTVAAVHLRGDFVPDELFELLDRIGSSRELRQDRVRFASLKWELAEAIWQQPLARLFLVEMHYRAAAGNA